MGSPSVTRCTPSGSPSFDSCSFLIPKQFQSCFDINWLLFATITFRFYVQGAASVKRKAGFCSRN